MGLRDRAHANKDVRESAARLYTSLREVNRAEHEYRLVPFEEWQAASDPDTCRREHDGFLSSHGFSRLCVVENLTLSRVYPEDRTLIHIFATADGRIAAGSWTLRHWRTLSFGTLLRDGRNLETSNAAMNRGRLSPPSTLTNVMDYSTLPETLLQVHRQCLETLLASDRKPRSKRR